MAMAASERLICSSNELIERRRGVRFAFQRYGAKTQGFVVRFNGKIYAYVNQCAHVPVELDWEAGELFDQTGLYLICSVHGATYAPDTGSCMWGPCRGRQLTALAVSEHNGNVYLLEDPQDG